MTIHVTPIPRVIDLAVPGFTLGTANAAGTAQTAVSSDSTLLVFDTTPPADVVAGSAVVGSATTAPRRDHQHSGLPGFDSTDPAAIAQAAVVGSATTVAHRDHVHPGIPGAGTVVDEAITRFNSTAGNLLQGYSSLSPTISDTGVISLTSGALKFPASAITSTEANTLWDYEIGTWTPQLADNSGDGSGEGQGYATQVGTYTKLGRVVSIQGVLEMSSLGSLTTSQSARILGLPFAPSTLSNLRQSFAVGRGSGLNLPAAYASVSLATRNGISYIEGKVWDGTGGGSDFLISEWSASGRIEFAGTYIV